MVSLFKKYREALVLKHGWEVDLKCPECGCLGKPKYSGWTPSYAMKFGSAPVIYANLTCDKCGGNLKDTAGKKLVELFSKVPVSVENKRILFWFIFVIAAIPIALISIFGSKAFMSFVFIPVLIFPAIMFFNYKVASLHTRCECGRPDYVFMGMLGRSYCHRCSSCGKLLRSRD